MGYGLLQVKNNDDLNKEEQEKIERDNHLAVPIEGQLAAHISRAWEMNKQAKRRIEDELLRCLRQRNGEYDPKKLSMIQSQGGSEIYMMLTATKCRAAKAWLMDIVTPDGERPWGIDPTPIPELPEFAAQAIARRIMETSMGMSDGDVMERMGALRDQVLEALREFAEQASDRMQDKIADQLAEGNWDNVIDQFLDDFVTFPGAIKKGPVVHRKKQMKWEGRPGVMKPKVTTDFALEHYRVSPFDAYPSPEAETCDDGEFIERLRFNRTTLYNLIGVEGYREDQIRQVLTQYGRGGLREWLWSDGERAKLEGKEYWWLRSETGTIDGIHYWGKAQGLLLLEWGVDPDEIDDPLNDYEIEAIKIGPYLIKVRLNPDPLGRRPYNKSCWEHVPGAFWGKALPFRMRDIQDVCNSTARALVNNMSMASGPMCEINYDRLSPEEDVLDIAPWRIYQTKESRISGNNPAVRFFQVSSNANELLAVYNEFERRADDATNVPRYTYGNERVGGAGQTASGLSMLMNSASRGIKGAVKSIDRDVVRPSIEGHFFYNMMYDSDPTIKGDCKVVARGASAILIREQVAMRQNELLQLTNNPIDMQILGVDGRAELLQNIFKNSDLPNLIPGKDQMRLRMEQEAQNQPPPPEILRLQYESESMDKKIAADAQQKLQEIEAERQEKELELSNQRLIEREKLAQERELFFAKLEADYRLAQDKSKTELEKERARRDADLRKIQEQARLQAETQEKEPVKPAEPTPQTPQPPTVIQLQIDNKSGQVKKRIDVQRGSDGLITGADVDESPV